MQTFISKYGLAAHLAFLAVAPLFLFPFCSEMTVAGATLWLALVGFVWMVMEPSRRADEMLHEARERVHGAIVRDPLVWLLTAFCVFALLRCFNGDLKSVYEARAWGLSEPVFANFPRAAEGKGFGAFANVLALLIVVTGCRQALGKSARIAFVATLAVCAGVLALTLVFRIRLTGEGAVLAFPAESPLLVSSASTAFALAALGASVASAGIFECKWNKAMILFVFAIGGSLTGLFFFTTPFDFTVFGVLWAGVTLGCVLYVALTQPFSAVLKFGALLLLALAIPVLVAIFIAPEELTQARLNLFGSLFPEGFWERRAALSAAAAGFWDPSPWLGRGLGSFGVLQWLSGAARTGLESDGALNGYWQLLAERGLIGAVMVLLAIVFLTVSLVRRVVCAWGRRVFWPLPVLGCLALFVVLAEAFVSSSPWRADTVLLAGALYALAAGSFPVPRKKTEEEALG